LRQLYKGAQPKLDYQWLGLFYRSFQQSFKDGVLKVGHHGSNSSSSADFLTALDAKYAVISFGEDNSYNHPAQGTMDRLKAAMLKLYRTDENGTIIAAGNCEKIIFNTNPGVR
jgi:competence protein ComEC